MQPFIPERAIFIHGLEGNSQGVKASLLRRLYPGMLIPDFPGSLAERMQRLAQITADQDGWTLIDEVLQAQDKHYLYHRLPLHSN